MVKESPIAVVGGRLTEYVGVEVRLSGMMGEFI